MSARTQLQCVTATVALSLIFAAVPAFAATRTEVLKDGTKIEIGEGNKVFAGCPCNRGAAIVKGFDWTTNPNPERIPAKDGTYTLENGKTIRIKGGRLVDAEEKAHKPITR